MECMLSYCHISTAILYLILGLILFLFPSLSLLVSLAIGFDSAYGCSLLGQAHSRQQIADYSRPGKQITNCSLIPELLTVTRDGDRLMNFTVPPSPPKSNLSSAHPQSQREGGKSTVRETVRAIFNHRAITYCEKSMVVCCCMVL